MQYILAHEGRLWVDAQDQILCDQPQLAGLTSEACYEVQSGVTLQLLAQAPGERWRKLDLRAALACADQPRFALLARAAQIATWHDRHCYCSRCATPLQQHGVDLAKECPACGLTVYPRISPCIIVLVVDGDRCLLAHNPRFPPGRYSTLAGFIEAGETAEAAVAREVREEVGVEVCNIRYMASQSWPFPHSLMLGFFADYAGGELSPDGEEITAADWFRADNLPDLPPTFAISRQLIERFLAAPGSV